MGIYEEDTNNEVPNNSNPSKKQILLQAVKDLNGEVDSNITLYLFLSETQRGGGNRYKISKYKAPKYHGKKP